MKRLGVVLILIAAFCGVANSTYLTQHEVGGTPLLCDINGLTDCNVVAASPYSHILGISLSEYGLIFYGLLFVLAAIELALFDRFLRRTIQGLALFGFLASLYFTTLQVFVIEALCVYCTASALLALLIFLFAWFIEPVRRNAFERPPSTPAPQPPRPSAFSMPPWPQA